MYRTSLFSFLFLLVVSTVCFANETASGLYFNSFGDISAPAILFIHGGPGYNSYTFEYGAAEELSKAGYYVVVFDQRGCGRSSDAKASTDFTFLKATDDMMEVIQTAGVHNPMLLGHSWGGALAIEFLKLHPGVARGAILLDAPISFPALLYSMAENTISALDQAGNSAAEADSKNRLNRMFPQGVSGPFKFTLDDISDSFVQAIQAGLYQPKAYSAEAIEIWKEMGSRPDIKWAGDSREEPPEGFEQNEGLYERDFTNDMITQKSSIYAAFGTEDRLFDQAQIDQVTGELPSGHALQIPGAAHYGFTDQRSTFIEVVKTFFGTPSAR